MLQEESDQRTTLVTMQTIQSNNESTTVNDKADLNITVPDNTALTLVDEELKNRSFEITIPEADGTQNITIPNLKPLDGFTAKAVEEHYTLLGRIHGGGEGNIFWAKKNNTGTHWVVKHIPRASRETKNEVELLIRTIKELNHHSLPTVIDIFEDDTGVFFVENFILGNNMAQVIKDNGRIGAFLLLDWASQLAGVINQLHRMKPTPIYHLDLKPANIMVAPYGNKLTLLDLGISREGAVEAGGMKAGTPSYAAPEQLMSMLTPKNEEIIQEVIKKRFKSLPSESKSWGLDARTDIYSIGVILFEAATGVRPNKDNMDVLRDNLSREFCDVIYKCLAINPKHRYQTVDALLFDIEKQNNQKVKFTHTLFMRRVTKAFAGLAIVLALGGHMSGEYFGRMMAQAMLEVTPAFTTVSVNQDAELRIQRQQQGDDYWQIADTGRIVWDNIANPIAQVDGNRIRGLSVGETTITGTYLGREIQLQVTVVPPMDGYVQISQRFRAGNIVSLFAGNEERDSVDGDITEMNFTQPTSMDITASGALYIADGMWLRRILNGYAETVRLPNPYTAQIVRAYGDDLIILTNEWVDHDGRFRYSILHRTSDGDIQTLLPPGDAGAQRVHDMVVSNGMVYLIEEHTQFRSSFNLRSININTHQTGIISELFYGTRSLAVDSNTDIIYLANSVEGIIYTFESGEFHNIAGDSQTRATIDGSLPNFIRPSRIRMFNGNLYVWDFNALRRIYLENGVARESVSLTGTISIDNNAPIAQESPAERMLFPNSDLMDFVITEDGVIISDPRRGVLWNFIEN